MYTLKQFKTKAKTLHGDSWINVPRSLVVELGGNEALLIHYLVNLHIRVTYCSQYEWNEGWFYCTVEKLEREMGFSDKVQRRLIKRLEETKLLERQTRGIPAKRHFRIDIILLERMIHDADIIPVYDTPDEEDSKEKWGRTGSARTGGTGSARTGGTRSAETGGSILSKKKENKKKERVPPHTQNGGNGRSNKSFGKDPLQSFCHSIATSIKRVLFKSDRTNSLTPESNIPRFAQYIQDLIVQAKIPKQEIKEVFDWYVQEENYNDQFTPKLKKPKDVYTKFGQIRDAMQRNQSKASHDDNTEYFDDKTNQWFARDWIDKLRGRYNRKYNGISIRQEELDCVLKEMDFEPGHISASAVYSASP